MAEFEDLASWAFKGEVFGESLFRGLQDAFPEHSGELSTLGDLEREMAAVLAPVLERHGIDADDCSGSRSAGVKAAAAMASGSWSDFIARFAAATGEALRKYHRLREISSEIDARAVDLLIAHEMALQSFARAYDGDTGRPALPAVKSVLADLRTALAE